MLCVSFHSENMNRASRTVTRQAVQFNGEIIDIGVLYFVNAIETRRIPPTHVTPTRNADKPDWMLIDFSLNIRNDK